MHRRRKHNPGSVEGVGPLVHLAGRLKRLKQCPIGLAVIGCLPLVGCARTPAGAGDRVERQLLVQFTVRGQVNPNRHYFFAVDATGNAAQGPVPAVAPPWGNGWGAGRITHYVHVNLSQPGFFGFYRFEPGSNLLAPVFLGQPLATDPIQNTQVVRFTLDLDRLQTPEGLPPGEINVNFITTDRIPIDPNDRSPKLVDALGFSGQSFVTLNAATNRIYRNAEASEPEAGGDVTDPDLDLIDWQIEVRRN